MTKITGYSDDNIELDGELTEEIPFDEAANSETTGHLALSDGTLLKVMYGSGGIWRFEPIMKGTLFDHIELGEEVKDTFDIVYMKDGLKWCLFTVTGQYNVVVKKD